MALSANLMAFSIKLLNPSLTYRFPPLHPFGVVPLMSAPQPQPWMIANAQDYPSLTPTRKQSDLFFVFFEWGICWAMFNDNYENGTGHNYQSDLRFLEHFEVLL